MRWTTDEINFLKENYSKKGIQYCSIELKKSQSSIKNKSNKLKLYLDKDVVSKNMSKNIIDVNEYKNVNDPRISYILGLLWTDGTVGFANNKSRTPVIKHTCIKSDSDIISKTFKDLKWRHFFNENNKSIGKNTMSAHWISNRELGEYLISNNFRKKSFGTTIYNNFNHEIIHHFVRGLFDGDGCFVVSDTQKGKYKQFSITFSSTYDQNWNYLTNILDTIEVKYRVRLCKDNLGKSSQLNIFDSKSIKNLCDFMYKNSESLRLERKFKKYIEFINYKDAMSFPHS
jgi:hypothetical protein